MILVSWSPLWAVVLALAAVLVLAVAAEAEPVTPEALMQEMRALRQHESPAEAPLGTQHLPQSEFPGMAASKENDAASEESPESEPRATARLRNEPVAP